MSNRRKPLVVVTRKLPDTIETRMCELFDTRLNLEDKPMSAAEIAEALREQYGIEVDKKRIKLEEPIKSLGITDITAHLYEQTDTKFKVEVLPLEASKN